MQNLLHLATAGGPVVTILFGFSLLGLTVIFLKLWDFRVLKSDNDKRLNEALSHLEAGDRSRAQLLVGDRTSPRALVIGRGLGLMDKHHWSASEVRDELARVARTRLAQLGSHLRVLEVLATTAPLLGLFGTVLGMIEAFHALETAGNRVDPSQLSGGIWKALLTTAVGLGVAIPISLCNSWFERRLENAGVAVNDDIGRLLGVNAEQRQGIADPATEMNHA